MMLSRQFSYRAVWGEQSHMTVLPCLGNKAKDINPATGGQAG